MPALHNSDLIRGFFFVGSLSHIGMSNLSVEAIWENLYGDGEEDEERETKGNCFSTLVTGLKASAALFVQVDVAQNAIFHFYYEWSHCYNFQILIQLSQIILR